MGKFTVDRETMNNWTFLKFLIFICLLYETLSVENKRNEKEFLKGNNDFSKEKEDTIEQTENQIKGEEKENTIEQADRQLKVKAKAHNVETLGSESKVEDINATYKQNSSDSSHILMFFPWNTKSHRIMQNALLEGLLARGHKVTGVFPQKSNIKHEHYTEIVVLDGFGRINNIMTKSMMEKDSTSPLQAMSVWPEMFSHMKDLMNELHEYSREVIENIEFRNETVELIMFTANFPYLHLDVFHHFRSPLIGISPPGWVPHLAKFLGNPENPAHQPELILPFVEPMSFLQRLSNTLFYSFSEMFFLGQWIPYFEEDFDHANMYEMLENVAALFLNSHFVTHSPQAWAANTIDIGGLHCKEGTALPDDLQLFLDSHPEGVVYVSFGSSVKPSQMTDEKKKVFLDTFLQLKHPVIWKWNEDDIPDLPPNVKLSKWLPQQDLLAHPNLKVFVTHGGLLSVQEALYHSTPLVGIPLGNDQKPNMLRAQRRGYAIMLDWNSLNTDQFVAAVNKAMNDEKMKENMKTMHELFIDARDPPLDRAMWWTEYVMRHGGAKFLRPPSIDLAWHQYHLLDVIGFIVIVVFIVTFIFIRCVMCCCRFLCKPKLKTE